MMAEKGVAGFFFFCGEGHRSLMSSTQTAGSDILL
jgi:hypothetical protein